MDQKRFDDLSNIKSVDTKANSSLDLGASVSQETHEALQRIDANLREAEQKSGTLLVAYGA
jgi:hypothetical protein